MKIISVLLLFLNYFLINPVFAGEPKIEDIPNVLCNHISSFLNTDDIFKLRSVSKKFKEGIFLSDLAKNSRDGLLILDKWRFLQEFSAEELLTQFSEAVENILMSDVSNDYKYKSVERTFLKYSDVLSLGQQNFQSKLIDLLCFFEVWDQVYDHIWSLFTTKYLQGNFQGVIYEESGINILNLIRDQLGEMCEDLKDPVWMIIWKSIDSSVLIQPYMLKNIKIDSFQNSKIYESFKLSLFCIFSMFNLNYLLHLHSHKYQNFKIKIIKELAENNKRKELFKIYKGITLPSCSSDFLCKHQIAVIKSILGPNTKISE